MGKIATIKTLVESLPHKARNDLVDIHKPNFKGALAKAKELNIAVDKRGRCYVPESLRGRGVGYNGKRALNRSDKAA